MWLAYVGDNIVPLYYRIIRAQTQQDIDDGVAALMQKFSFVVKHSNGMINGSDDCYFNGTKQFTVLDCAILPFLERMVVVLKYWKKVDIFATRNENEDVNKWYKYWQFGRQRESFQRSIYDFSWFEKLPQNPMTVHLGMTDVKSFEPQTYMCKVYEFYANPPK